MTTLTLGDQVKQLRPASPAFDYDKAFYSNIGWVTEAEQATLKTKRVAIAGLGGVGGNHLLTLVRLGVTKFAIADLDRFEPHNFNRQVGATMANIGRPKVEVLAEMARAINPDCELDLYPRGVHADNLESFFKDVDLYVDGLDFFAFEAREAVFAYCAKFRIPAITVAPLGMSAALLNFLPGGMSFENYFQLKGLPEMQKAVRFLVGVAPALLHRGYLADASRLNLKEHRAPSTFLACQLCAGVAGTEALKILLKRGKVWGAPHGIQFDGYSNRTTHTWRPGGNRHPLNRLAIAFASHKLVEPFMKTTAAREDKAKRDIKPSSKAIIDTVGVPMPSPLKVGRLNLPPHVKRALLPLMRTDTKGFLGQWALAWGTILASIVVAYCAQTWWMTLVAIFIIATRQNLLGLLMHEQAHWLASRSKWSDYFSELLIAYPLMVTLEGYHRVHLTHHVEYFTDKDPDYKRKQGKEWTFPQHMAYFLGILLRDLTGINIAKAIKAKGIEESSSAIPANFYPPRWLKLVFLGTMATVLILTHTWKIYLIYWLLPLLTVLQGFIRLGAISEHKYNLIDPSVEASTPLIELRGWEKLLFPNLNFTLHIYHHWFPNIPALSLPKVHQIFRDAGLVDDRYVFHGYGEYLRYLMAPSRENLQERRIPSTAPATPLYASVAGSEVPSLTMTEPSFPPVSPRGISDVSLDQAVRLIISEAMTAPSPDNAQPWKFEWTGKKLFVFHNEGRARHSLNKKNHISMITFGALLEAIQIAASRFSLVLQTQILFENGETSIQREKGEIYSKWAEIIMTYDEERRVDPLVSSMQLRYTDRRPYEGGSLEAPIFKEIKNLCHKDVNYGIYVQRPTDVEFNKYFVQSEDLFWRNHKVIADLTRWLRLTPEEAKSSRDGMTWKNIGISILEAYAFRILRRFPKSITLFWYLGMKYKIRSSAKAALSTSAGLICITQKGPVHARSLVRVGQLAYRVWLMLNRQGYGVQPLTFASHSIAELMSGAFNLETTTAEKTLFAKGKSIIQNYFGLDRDEIPMWMFRTGLSKDPRGVERTPRRTIQDVFKQTQPVELSNQPARHQPRTQKVSIGDY